MIPSWERITYMARKAADQAVRAYLTGLKNPAALRDDDRIKNLNERIVSTDDPVERLRLQQERINAETPSVDGIEDAFITHAKAWADDLSVTADAFIAEGVDPSVLRRAGFRVAGGRGGRKRAARSARSSTTRVSVDEIRSALPAKNSTFTIRNLVDATGASVGSVRKVIAEELEANRLTAVGSDPDHSGPGRAATLYKRR